MPERIQRRRLLGWRKPEGAVYVGRGSKWGNPFVPGKYCTLEADEGRVRRSGQVFVRDADHAVRLYQLLMTTGVDFVLFTLRDASRHDLAELRGRNLMCWCKPGVPCHADVLLELANA